MYGMGKFRVVGKIAMVGLISKDWEGNRAFQDDRDGRDGWDHLRWMEWVEVVGMVGLVVMMG
jgi:hypothetical protein